MPEFETRPTHSEPDTSWSVTLPTLHGLFKTSTTSLLRPFSITSIKNRFIKSLPPTKLLDPILALAPPTALELSNQITSFSSSTITTTTPVSSTSPSSATLVKALVDLQSFATQLKSFGKDAPAHLDALMEAYMCAVYACGRYDGPEVDIHKALIPCLEGVFLLRSIRSEVKKVDMAILRTITSRSIDHSHDHLRPIIQRSIQMVYDLKQSLRRGDAVRAQSPTLIPTVSHLEAKAAITAIDTFVSGVEGIQSIDGKNPPKTKADKEYSMARPRRVALDARLVAAFLCMTMATIHVKDARRRARSEFTQGKGEEEEAISVAGEEDSGIEWETMAETRLKECLVKAWELVDQRKTDILVENLVNAHFTGEMPGAVQEQPRKKRDSQASPTDEEERDGKYGHHKQSVDDKDEDEDDDDDDEEEEEEDENEAGYPCPLRSLFELHERYEELRLAVWMSLPSDIRPKMTAFLRGSDGEVGNSWDDLGLSLLLDLSGEVLMGHGLPAEKLDKWVELGKQRSAKKVRRRK